MKKENGWPPNNEAPRPKRPEGMGRFQCRDVATGALLWSSNAIAVHGGAEGIEWHGTHALLADGLLVACGDSKFDIARITDQKLEVLATVEQGMAWNAWQRRGDSDYSDPVLADGMLFIRPQATYEANLSCYDLRVKK